MGRALAILWISPAASADDWGVLDADTGPTPDHGQHTYCYDASVSQDLRDNILTAEANLESQTQADVQFQSSCVTTGTTGQTDVRWRQIDLPSGVSGSVGCDRYWSDDTCDRARASLDLAEISLGSFDEEDETQSACHELGHTVGLTHATNDCMKGISSPDPGDPSNFEYSPHHVSHIDTWF